MASTPSLSVIIHLVSAMAQKAKYDIFLDGSCSFCRWSRGKIEPYDSGGRLRFLDYNDPAVGSQAPFPRAELDQEMHMRTPEGKWLRGFEAWLALLRVLPKVAWLGKIAGLPPLHWLGPPLYGFIARHRYSLPGAPARCEDDTCAPPAHGSH
jgi:predicted DCC family thiol-disulfide oxidoreductase YuxK